MNGLPAEDKETKRKIILSISVILFFVIGIIAGCAVRNPDVEPGEPAPVAKLEGKKIAVLPVCSDKSIATSSQLQLQKKVNRELAKKIKNFLPSAKIMDSIETTNKLNRQNKLSVTFFRWWLYAAFLLEYSSGHPSLGNMLPYSRCCSSS